MSGGVMASKENLFNSPQIDPDEQATIPLFLPLRHEFSEFPSINQ
jgi:hypothetical protein